MRYTYLPAELSSLNDSYTSNTEIYGIYSPEALGCGGQIFILMLYIHNYILPSNNRGKSNELAKYVYT